MSRLFSGSMLWMCQNCKRGTKRERNGYPCSVCPSPPLQLGNDPCLLFVRQCLKPAQIAPTSLVSYPPRSQYAQERLYLGPPSMPQPGPHVKTLLSPMSSLTAWVYFRAANTMQVAVNASSSAFSAGPGRMPLRCPAAQSAHTHDTIYTLGSSVDSAS